MIYGVMTTIASFMMICAVSSISFKIWVVPYGYLEVHTLGSQ